MFAFHINKDEEFVTKNKSVKKTTKKTPFLIKDLMTTSVRIKIIALTGKAAIFVQQ